MSPVPFIVCVPLPLLLLFCMFAHALFARAIGAANKHMQCIYKQLYRFPYIYIYTHNICAYTHTFIDTCLYKIVGKWEWCLSSMLTEQLRTADIMLLYGSLIIFNNILCNMNHGFYLYCGNIAL